MLKLAALDAEDLAGDRGADDGAGNGLLITLDMDLARTFPRETCLRWCVLPFDRMSKSILVATNNPFNQQAAKELAAATSSRLLWYIAAPAELVKIVPPPRGWEPLEAAPSTPVAPLAKSAGGAKVKGTKSFGRSTARAADTSIGE